VRFSSYLSTDLNPIAIGHEERDPLLLMNSSCAMARSMASIVSWILTNDTHSFRVTARVFLRQCSRSVSTIFNLPIPRGDRFLNVIVFLSHSLCSLPARSCGL
jgi:hypothetical protein